MNSVDLNITKIEYQGNNSTSSLTGSVEFDEEYEQARVKFNQSIKVKRKIFYLNIHLIQFISFSQEMVIYI